jgi:hypothetical protein
MNGFLAFVAVVSGISKTSFKEITIQIASLVKHLIEKENIVIIDSD